VQYTNPELWVKRIAHFQRTDSYQYIYTSIQGHGFKPCRSPDIFRLLYAIT